MISPLCHVRRLKSTKPSLLPWRWCWVLFCSKFPFIFLSHPKIQWTKWMRDGINTQYSPFTNNNNNQWILFRMEISLFWPEWRMQMGNVKHHQHQASASSIKHQHQASSISIKHLRANGFWSLWKGRMALIFISEWKIIVKSVSSVRFGPSIHPFHFSEIQIFPTVEPCAFCHFYLCRPIYELDFIMGAEVDLNGLNFLKGETNYSMER